MTAPREPEVVDRRGGEIVLTAAVLLVLLALVALAAGGRPLGLGGGQHGGRPSTTFFDYAWTTLLLVIAAGIVTAAWAILANRPELALNGKPRRWWLGMPIFFAVVAVFAFAVLGARGLNHHGGAGGGALFGNPNSGLLARTPKGQTHTAHFRWEELAAVLGAVGLLAAFTLARRRPGVLTLPAFAALRRERISAALDDAVDDLRAEPDVRRAVIAAYARTERALARSGLVRKPAEAPFEYLERALGELEASAPSINRLTELFERAKFSAREPEPGMRDEAIDALLAVRDELRQRDGAAVPA